MGGFITKTEVLENAAFIINAYGQEVYDYCLTAKNETFLSILVKFNKI